MSAPRRLSDVVDGHNAPLIAASLVRYGYVGPCDAEALVWWLRAQGPLVDTQVVAPARTYARAPRPHQARFRAALLEAYGGRCALTGCDVAQALEAAHVADWRDENDIGAGMVLRVDLHRLHERALLLIDADYTVCVSPAWYGALKGRRLRLPHNRLHWPRLAHEDAGCLFNEGERR